MEAVGVEGWPLAWSRVGRRDQGRIDGTAKERRVSKSRLRCVYGLRPSTARRWRLEARRHRGASGATERPTRPCPSPTEQAECQIRRWRYAVRNRGSWWTCERAVCAAVACVLFLRQRVWGLGNRDWRVGGTRKRHGAWSTSGVPVSLSSQLRGGVRNVEQSTGPLAESVKLWRSSKQSSASSSFRRNSSSSKQEWWSKGRRMVFGIGRCEDGR